MPIGVRRAVRDLSFSVGAKINLLFAAMVILFIGFSYYSKTVLDRYSAAYDRQVAMHSSIIALKDSFMGCGDSFSEYLKTGNRERLAEFNRGFGEAKDRIGTLYGQDLGDEMLYLLRSVEISADTYFRECCNASFLFNSKNFSYYERFHYAESILNYLRRYCDELTEAILQSDAAENVALMQQRRVFRIWTSGINGALILLLGGFLAYVTTTITLPLGRLVVQARAISRGRFDVRVSVRNPNNSVGVLAEAFNGMAASIKSMMEEIRENVETEKKLLEERHKNLEYQELLNQATFLALQTQTNPHFLFNTLSSISRSVTLGRKEQTLVMIDALASLLRYSLADASEPVSLADELAVTREYLKIQTVRFKDRMSAEFRIEEGIDAAATLPRFTLQPLVENAIIHGLEPKAGPGRLIVTARRRGTTAVIRIYDDGAGVPREKLALIRERRSQSLSKRIGIWNTQKRLLIYTRREDSFVVSSRPGGGTLVTLKIPLGDNNACTS